MSMEGILVFLPEDQKFAAPGRGDAEVILHSWWVIHPEKGLAFARDHNGQSKRFCHPQCNPSEIVAKKLQQKIYPSLQVRFEDVVYVRRNADGSYPIPAGAMV
jgi:hypothetical protein